MVLGHPSVVGAGYDPLLRALKAQSQLGKLEIYRASRWAASEAQPAR